MFDLPDTNSVGSGFCLGSIMGSVSEQLLQVWSPGSSPATSGGSTSSNDMKIVMDELSSMKQLLDMLVGQAGIQHVLPMILTKNLSRKR